MNWIYNYYTNRINLQKKLLIYRNLFEEKISWNSNAKHTKRQSLSIHIAGKSLSNTHISLAIKPLVALELTFRASFAVWIKIKLQSDLGSALSFTILKETIFNPFPRNDTFWRPWETSLLKALWEKEKLLVTSNFSFSLSVFYPFG